MGQRLYNRYNYVLYGKDGEQLMNYSLKAELDNCYSYADSLDNDGYGARQKTGLKTREMLQFDLLQFLAYLSSFRPGRTYPGDKICPRIPEPALYNRQIPHIQI